MMACPAKSIARPGLRRALWMLDVGKADAVVVVKLDRLTRSVGAGVPERYFGEGNGVVSACGGDSVIRASAAEKLVNVLMSVAQWEREAICERTREECTLKQLGVHSGAARLRMSGTRCSGNRLPWSARSRRRSRGTRGIARIRELCNTPMSPCGGCAKFDRGGSPCRGKMWYSRTLHSVLQRAGVLIRASQAVGTVEDRTPRCDS